MKTTKRIIAAILGLTMMSFTFTACKKAENEQPSNETQVTEATENTDSGSVSPEWKSSSARVTVDGTKFMVDGKEFWINGVNTPWHNWNDFNGSMDEKFWDDTFAQLAADNINCTRIWINCEGESVVNLKSTGEVKFVNEKHWADLDKLFTIAEKHGVYVMATLLSFDHFKDGNGGAEEWRKLVTSKEFSDGFAETYVKEFCKRYGSCEYLFSIDIMNEPDWVHENAECGKQSWDDLSYFFGTCAAAIHESCDTLVTVGMGIIKYNSEKYEGNVVSDEYLKKLTGNDKAYVDFESTHYYNWQKQYFGFPFDKTPVEFGLDGTKPCVIGETHNDDEKEAGMTLTEKYKTAYENGWNGIMVWMQTDDNGEFYHYDLTQKATNDMNDFIPEKVHPLG